MKTKPADPIPTAFPTCGEVFYFVITALDLTAWADAFHQEPTRRRTESEIKDQSDRLRDWAAECDGRVPSRKELEQFIGDQIASLPRAKDLHFILTSAWANLLENYAHEVCHNASPFGRDETRAWCAQAQAPRMLYFLWAFQKLLGRLAPIHRPIVGTTLDSLLRTTWSEVGQQGLVPKYPLQQLCYNHFATCCADSVYQVEPETIGAWNRGDAPPSFEALGRRFRSHEDRLGIVLNFAFAKLVEAIAAMLKKWILPEAWPECQRMLLEQACCVHSLDEAVNAELSQLPNMSLTDYARLLGGRLGDYMHFLVKLSRAGLDALDITVARYRVHLEYDRFIAPLPAQLGDFTVSLEKFWKATALRAPQPDYSAIQKNVATLKARYPEWSDILQGPLLVIEARITLGQEHPSPESLNKVFRLYQQAVAAARYQAGEYGVRITREALGFAALLHRRESSEGSIKPWLKNMLDWWDLLGMGDDFCHETLERRIELAEIGFTDGLHNNLRTRLKAALPELGLQHQNIGGYFGFTDPHYADGLRATPLDPRQKRPMMETVVGRVQTPLMEAIDRRQLETAQNLVRKGDDLNFINSTGDTCLTKAFAAKYYDLILEILQRDHDPIRRETILRLTDKKKISGLQQVLSHGHATILRELCRQKQGRGEAIDLKQERLWCEGYVTPLYYAVNVLAGLKMPTKAAYLLGLERHLPPNMLEKVSKSPDLKWLLDQARELQGVVDNPEGLQACIDFMIAEQQAQLDSPNINDHSALTCAAEGHLHDVVAKLLAAGANVNHRFKGGGTALALAVQADDFEMVRLLLEFNADFRLFVDVIGRPIFAMPMSERVRKLIPNYP